MDLRFTWWRERIGWKGCNNSLEDTKKYMILGKSLFTGVYVESNNPYIIDRGNQKTRLTLSDEQETGG